MKQKNDIIQEVNLKSENELHEFISEKCKNDNNKKWTFRGHGDPKWELNTSLLRNWKNPNPERHK